MKNLIGVILAVALVADLAIFFGIGFGVGALSVTGTNPNTAYTFTYANAGSSWGDGLSYHVDMTTINQSGQPMTTALLPGAQSTSLTFQTIFASSGDCGNTHEPTISASTSITTGWAYYVVSFGGQMFTGSLDGSAFPSTTALGISENSSGLVVACGLNGGVDAVFPTTLGSGGYVPAAFQHTLTLTGVYAVGTLSVTMNAHVTNCNGGPPSGGGTTVCSIAATAGAHLGWPNGGSTLSSVASTKVQSGYGTVTVNNPGNLVGNGGTISISVQTGYAGSQGWTVSMLCPVPRTASSGGCTGGANDSRFAAQSVQNNCGGCLVTWTVPSGTSQNVNTTGWNTWEVELTNGLFHEGYAPVTINLVPPGGPGSPNLPGPTLTFNTNGSFYYPGPGDVLTLTIHANASSSATVASIMLWVYYMPPGGNPVNEPGCGSFWVTAGCPFGQTLGAAQVQPNGANGLVGTYSFTVAPPAGTTQIGVLMESFTSGQQGSAIVPYLLQITPHGCTVGTPGCVSKTGASIWTMYGPLLLSIALVLAGLLVAFWVPMPALWRIVVVVLPIVGVVVFYLTGLYAQWFQPVFH